MVKLRLRRMGRRKRPLYAIVAADSRSPRDGRYIEDLGRYEPLQEPAALSFKQDRVLHWLEQGAQPSDTVRSLLSREGIMLALHMRRKGAEAEAIEEAVEAHRAAVAAKWDARKKTTAKDRKEKALSAEMEVADKMAADLAKQRAAQEAKAKAEAEDAQRAAAEERARAAEEAKKEQEAANEAAAEADEAAPEAAAEEAPSEEAAAEEVPAEEAAAEAEPKG